MKVALAVLCLALAASAASNDGPLRRRRTEEEQHDFVRGEFELFKEKFGRAYQTPEEEAQRLKVFRDNLKNIQEHNLSGKSWKMGVNKFSDLTRDEYMATLNGYTNIYQPSSPVPILPSKRATADLSALPESAMWTDSLSPVKDQGGCGSCWAFTATEMIESYSFIENGGSIQELSTQQLTSCTQNPNHCGGTGGCQGSVPQLAFTYAELYGVASEADYPYVSGSDGETHDCDYNPADAQVYVRGWERLPRNDQNAVMAHLSEVGPLAVAVDASNWHNYESGVFEGCDYDKNIMINHAVQLVGYGTDDDLGDYWLVRNSWGSSYGEEGFIRVRRESAVRCGEDSTPQYGTACEDDQWMYGGGEAQEVCGQCAILFDVTFPIGAFEV